MPKPPTNCRICTKQIRNHKIKQTWKKKNLKQELRFYHSKLHDCWMHGCTFFAPLSAPDKVHSISEGN